MPRINVEKWGNLYVAQTPEGDDFLRRPIDSRTAKDIFEVIERPVWKGLGERLEKMMEIRAQGAMRLFDSPALDSMKFTRQSGVLKEGAVITTTSPQVRHPLFNFLNFYVPSDRPNVNTYIRYYYTFHPLIRNGIQLLTDLTVSDFSFDAKDSKITTYFNDLMEDLSLFEVLRKAAKEYFLYGDDVSLWYWDDEIGAWGDINDQLANELVEVIHIPLVGRKGSTLYFYDAGGVQVFEEMIGKLPEELREEILEAVHPAVREAAEEGKKIHLNAFNVMHIRDPQYGTRGLSRVASCLKELLYEDILRYAQWKLAETRAGVVRIYKLGSDSFPTSPEAISDFAAMMTQFEGDVTPEIYWNHAISVEDVGVAGKYLPIVTELQFVEDRILTALGLNKALTRAEGPAYAPASVAYTAFQDRIINERRNIQKAVEEKMSMVSIVQGFIYRSKAELQHNIRRGTRKIREAFRKLVEAELVEVSDYKQYLEKSGEITKRLRDVSRAIISSEAEFIVPKMVWHDKLKREADAERLNFAVSMYEKGRVPFSLVCELAGWNKHAIERGLEEEYNTFFNPAVQQVLQQSYAEAYKKYLEQKHKGEAASPPKMEMGFGGKPGVEEIMGELGEGGLELGGEEGEATGLRGPGEIGELMSPELPTETGEL